MNLDLPLHGLELDPAVLVLVAVVCIPLAEAARAGVAVLLGDDTPRSAHRLWRVHRNLHLFGGVLVPALLALVGGLVVGWPSPVPVADRVLARWRRVAIALAAPTTHCLLGLVGLGLEAARGVGTLGDVGSAILLVNWLTAGLLLVPAPPLPGGALLAALVPPLDRRGGRWDRLRRTDMTPWALGILALAVAVHTVVR